MLIQGIHNTITPSYLVPINHDRLDSADIYYHLALFNNVDFLIKNIMTSNFINISEELHKFNENSILKMCSKSFLKSPLP